MAKSTTTERYIETIGRRKTAIARARLTPASTMSVVVNDKDVKQYFVTTDLHTTVVEPFLKAATQPFTVTAKVSGGGIAGQAVAVRHAIARALVEYNAELRGELKTLGFLKRDPRAKERRKAGLKKARKSPQWSKR